MAISKEFENAIFDNDIILARIMLKDIMLIDTSLKQFDEMLFYAEENLSNLYDVHDSEELVFNQEQWDKAYLNNQMVAVVNNFSKERINLLKEMVKHIYPLKSNPTAMSTPTQTSGRGSCTYGEESRNGWSTRKKIGTGMVTTGAITAVAGVCVAEGVIIASGIGVAAIGAGLIITDKG